MLFERHTEKKIVKSDLRGMLKSQDYVHYYRCRLTTSSGSAPVTFLQIEWGGRMKSGNSSSFATARAQKTFEDFKKEWGGRGA